MNVGKQYLAILFHVGRLLCRSGPPNAIRAFGIDSKDWVLTLKLVDILPQLKRGGFF
jgi:hypothetical protein